MRGFLAWARKATLWALAALIVGIPGCTQIDLSMGPGVEPDPTPGWATALAILSFLGLLALIFLIPARVLVRISLFIKEGAGTRGDQRLAPPTGRRISRADQLRRLGIVVAVILVVVGIGFSIDTDAEWVFPDRQSGWFGIPLAILGGASLAGGWWHRIRPESQLWTVGRGVIAITVATVVLVAVGWVVRESTRSAPTSPFVGDPPAPTTIPVPPVTNPVPGPTTIPVPGNDAGAGS
jgi:hypothetical protein